MQDYLTQRAQTIDASTIVLCSEFPNITPESLHSFASEVFPGSPIPNIVYGTTAPPIQNSNAVYFYFGFSEKAGRNFAAGDCLNAFPPLLQPYSEILRTLADGVGTQPDFLPNATLYEPIVERQKTILENGAVIVLYLGWQGSHFPHVLTAHQYLFGLPNMYCRSEGLCSGIVEITW